MCTLESHKGFVCTVTLRAMCDIALLFDGFAPKPLRKNKKEGVMTPSFFIGNVRIRFPDPVQNFRLLHLHQEGSKIVDQRLNMNH